MIRDTDLLDRLAAFPTEAFSGQVFRATRPRCNQMNYAALITANCPICATVCRTDGSAVSVIREFRTTVAGGKSYSAKYYNLDAIIAVGRRVSIDQAHAMIAELST